MKWTQTILIFIVLLTSFASCDDSWIEKPKKLLPERKMVDMLVDLHVSNSLYNQIRYKEEFDSLKSEDFYYSVLHKHEVADSIFEKSIVYYSHFPKRYEKIYAIVLDRLVQLNQEKVQIEQNPIDIGNE